jgi:drug/metabolite transporter (DMT)-like permease
LVLAIGVLASSTASIFIRFAQESAPSLVIAAYRVGIASFILVLIVSIRKDVTIKEIKGRNLWLSIVAGIFLAAHFATWVTSLEYTTVASSVVLVSTSPLFVAVFSPIFLKEGVNPILRYALALSLLGTTIIALSDSCLSTDGFRCPPIQSFFAGNALKGDLLALGGALSGAGYMLIGRKVREKVSLLPYITLVYSVAAIILFLMVAGAGQPVTGFPPTIYILFGLLAIIPQLVGHSSINWALRFLTAAFVSITLLGEPIGSSILAMIILGETPGWLMVVGAILILSGIVIASLLRGPETSTIEGEAQVQQSDD